MYYQNIATCTIKKNGGDSASALRALRNGACSRVLKGKKKGGGTSNTGQSVSRDFVFARTQTPPYPPPFFFPFSRTEADTIPPPTVGGGGISSL